MADKFIRSPSNIEGPATDGFTITPGTSAFTQPTRAIYVGATGSVCVQMSAATNTVLTFVAVPAGTTLVIRAAKVFANSTANSMVGLF